MSADRTAAPSVGGAAERSISRTWALSLLPLLLGGCEWFTDFKDQPRIEPWESVVGDSVPQRGNPQLSVSIYGTAVPGFAVSLKAPPDSMSGVRNPQPATDSSLANGRRHYQINCTVCHGADGAGRGPVLAYGLPAPSLLSDNAKSYSDGYLFGIIRNGRGLMPNYARIEEPDRWDVVNYLRGLQGTLGREVSTEPAGAPGENGPAVPSYSRMAPTRPPPQWTPAAAGPDESRRQADSLARARSPARP